MAGGSGAPGAVSGGGGGEGGAASGGNSVGGRFGAAGSGGRVELLWLLLLRGAWAAK